MNVFNKFGVSAFGKEIAILMPPRRLTPADAIEFAALVVVLAEIQAELNDEKLPSFDELKTAVRQS